MAENDLYYVENFLPVGTQKGQQGILNKLRSAYNAQYASIPGYDYEYYFVVQGRYFIAAATITNGARTNAFVIYEVSTSFELLNTYTFTSTVGNTNQCQCRQWNNNQLLYISPVGYFIFTFTGSGAPTSASGGSGITGSSIEIFQQRVWIANYLTVVYTAPGTNNDFSIGDGAGAFLLSTTDTFIIGLKQMNGFLYLFGSFTINVLSNVQVTTTTTGGVTTAITTFNVYPVSQDIGASYRETIQVFGRVILFMNFSGIFEINGGTVRKISGKIDLVFDPDFFYQANSYTDISTYYNPFGYSGSLVTYKGKEFYAVNVITAFFNNTTGAQSMYVNSGGGVSSQSFPYILMFDGQDWFIYRGYYGLVSLTGTSYVVSGVLQPGAPTGYIPSYFLCQAVYNSNYTLLLSDGTFTYRVLQLPDATMPKIARTNLSEVQGSSWLIQKQGFRLFLGMTSYIQDFTTQTTLSVDTEVADDIASKSWQINITYPTNPDTTAIPKPAFYSSDIDVFPCLLGLTLTTTLGDVELYKMSLMVKDNVFLGA